MPKSYKKREKERLRLLHAEASRGSVPAGTRLLRQPWWRKRRRITDGLIGLGSAAILAVYSVGYLHTERAQGNDLSQAVTQAPIVAQAPAATAAPGSSGPLALIGTPTPSPAHQSGYKDGKYVATGSSRHGDIEATVVIQNGKIASASVSDCSTRYPCRDVNPLIKEVITSQKAPVDYVSGATDSSIAYRDAVRAALKQAS